MKLFTKLNSWLAGAALVGIGLAVAPATASADGATTNSIGAAVEFQNIATGQCLDVTNGAPTHGALVGMANCHNGANQNWLIVPVTSAPGFDSLRSINSNMCLDLRTPDEAGVHPGTLVQQWDCFPDGIGSEVWRLQLDNSGGPGALNLVTLVKGLCLDTDSHTGKSVHLANCVPGTRSQMWVER